MRLVKQFQKGIEKSDAASDANAASAASAAHAARAAVDAGRDKVCGRDASGVAQAWCAVMRVCATASDCTIATETSEKVRRIWETETDDMSRDFGFDRMMHHAVNGHANNLDAPAAPAAKAATASSTTSTTTTTPPPLSCAAMGQMWCDSLARCASAAVCADADEDATSVPVRPAARPASVLKPTKAAEAEDKTMAEAKEAAKAAKAAAAKAAAAANAANAAAASTSDDAEKEVESVLKEVEAKKEARAEKEVTEVTDFTGAPTCPCLESSKVFNALKTSGYVDGNGSILLKGIPGIADGPQPVWPMDRNGRQGGAVYGGGSCMDHDQPLPPSCADNTGRKLADSPAWCLTSWCFVDAASCDRENALSAYFPAAKLMYSYDTCGSEDTFTAVKFGATLTMTNPTPARKQAAADALKGSVAKSLGLDLTAVTVTVIDEATTPAAAVGGVGGVGAVGGVGGVGGATKDAAAFLERRAGGGRQRSSSRSPSGSRRSPMRPPPRPRPL